MSEGPLYSRRSFLVLLPVALIAVGGERGWAASSMRGEQKKPHPTPRRGIDASHVVAARELDGDADAIETFDMIRQIPEIADGIRCSCGCDEAESFYSLLSCFERDGMARECPICKGHARLIHRLHRQGKTLAQIRTAVDAAYP
jgi:hypothetical protein